ncbi:P-loop containing nucleoside triphosphate hydrolase protein [Phlebopus sp. FC_14]|nr:P-loop containing nucleoside triphosphate hydrolase protein [Phlebopus sp. FC_14]
MLLWTFVRGTQSSCYRHGFSSIPIRKISTNPLDIFKYAGSAEFLAAAADANSLPRLNKLPEIIVTGRANVGKSTLLNAVVGRKKLLFTSKRAGRTQTLNFFRVGPKPGKLVVVDAPGYGSRGRPEWGELFNHYIANRKELRRIYILVSAVHGLGATDEAMLAVLDAQVQASGGTQFTLQAIITKADDLKQEGGREQMERIKKAIFVAAPTCLPPIVTACPPHGHPFGIDVVRKSIIECCGLRS